MQLGRDELPGTDDDVPQVPGEFMVWGGDILSVGNYDYPADFDYFGSHEITITLRIRAASIHHVLSSTAIRPTRYRQVTSAT